MSGSTIVANGNTLDISGIIPFLTIELQGTTANTDLVLTADTTLNDSGTILLDGADSRIYGNSSSGNTLDNVNGTIEGAGQIGVNNSGLNLSLINESAATIDADGTVQLAFQLEGSPAADNAGLIEATNTGGLLIQGGVIDDFIGALVGTIAATGTGAVVNVQNSDIAGGTLTDSSGGLIETTGNSTIDGSTTAVDITSGSTVELSDNSTLFLNGTIDDTGIILDATTGDNTDIRIDGGDTASLTGGGVLDLAGVNARIDGTSGTPGTLDNLDNTIEGSGSIGVNNSGLALALINEAVATIDANATAAMVLELSGSPAVLNAGLMEATGSGELAILDGEIINLIGTTEGTIAAVGSSAVVSLQNADIAGGLLETSGGGVIAGAPGTTNTLDGSVTPVTITSGSTVELSDNSTLFLNGTIDDTGIILDAATGDNTDIRIDGGDTASLTGGGVLDLAGVNARIDGTSGTPGTLDNLDNTIEGSGSIGVNNSGLALALINEAAATIDANATAAMVLELSGSPAVLNAGLMEATGSGELAILDGEIINLIGTTEGTIAAVGSSAVVSLQNADIAGGLLETSGGGVIAGAPGTTNTLDGSVTPVTITSGSTVELSDNSTLFLNGTIDDTGIILDAATGDNTDIRIAGGDTASLIGGGVLDLAGVNARIDGTSGTAAVLDNFDTIEGAGSIGVNNGGLALAVVNEAGSTIDANSTAGLVIELGGPTLSNDGLLEDTGTGGLSFAADTTIDNTGGGTILASGAGASVLLSNAVVLGGVLETSGGGLIEIAPGTANNTIDGSVAPVTITTGSTVELANNSTLFLNGTIDTAGTILDDAGGNDTDILIAGGDTVSLSSGGVVDLAGVNALIFGTSSTPATLDNFGTIEGAGSIGVNNSDLQLAVVNEIGGTIDANSTAGLIIELGGPTLSNDGLLEDTGTGGLSFANGTEIDNTGGGTILASGAGASVVLSNGTVLGGLLETSNGGVIEAAPGTTNTLDGSVAPVTITTGSTVELANNSTLFLNGTIDTAGTILDDAGGNDTDIRITGGDTFSLTGAGVLDLAGVNARIYGTSSTPAVLDNFGTIEGAGSIGVNNSGLQLAVVNEAGSTIDANSTAGLVIELGGPTLSNDGLLEDTGTGGLSFAADTTIDNTGGGTVLASGAGASVLLSNAVVLGGALESSGGGLIEIAPGTANNTIDGSTAPVTITTGSTVELENNSTLFLNGTIDTAGTIIDAATSNDTDIRITGGDTFSLTGAGVLDLAGVNARIFGTSGTPATLDNFGTIEGEGSIGVDNSGLALAVVNEIGGTIDASSTATLLIEPGGPVVTNAGVMEGTGSGGLQVNDATITNTGTVQALDGSNVTFDTNVTTTNNSGGTLTGGTWAAYSTGDGSHLDITGGAITDDAATIILSGSLSTLDAYNGSTYVAIDQSLTAVDTVGTLEVLDGRDFTTANTITDSGLITLGGGTFASSSLDITGTGTLDGFGTVTDPTNDGTIAATVSGETMLITTPITGTGDLVAGAGATLELGSSVAATQTLVADPLGTVKIDDPAGFASGTILDLAPGGTLDFGATTVTSATISGGSLDIVAGGTSLSYALTTPDPLDRLAIVANSASGDDVVVYRIAQASSVTPNPVVFGEQHVGSTLTQALTIANIDTNDGYSENLDSAFSGTSGGITASGSVSLLAAGSSSSALGITLDSAADGTITGAATIVDSTDGAGVDGNPPLAIGTQTIAASGTLFNFATASAIAPNPVTLGERHVGDVVTEGFTIANTATADGFSENLDAGFTAASSGIATSGTVSELAAGASSTALGATIDLTSDGVFAGAATLGLISDGSTIDTLGTTALPSQTIGVGATVYNFATASAIAPNPVTLGEHHVGDVITQGFTIANTATADGFSENLDAAFTGATSGIITAGTVSELGAGTSSTALGATIDLTSDGVFAGAATLGLISDGSTIDTLGTTALPSQTIGVGATVYNFATASAIAPNPVTLGEHHVGDVITQGFTIANTATADGFSENLDAAFTGATSGIITAGTVSELGAGTSSTALGATIDLTGDGVFAGAATLGLISDGSTIDTLGTTALPSQTIGVGATVYNFATASAIAPNPVTLGEHHVGDVITQGFTIANTATADGFSENLDAAFTGATSGIITAGTVSELGAGTSSTALGATIDLTGDGVFTGAATLGLISDGSTIDTLGTTALPSQTIGVGATVYNFAIASAAPDPLALGEHHVGDVITQGFTIANTATADGFSENLDAAFTGATSGIITAGTVSELGAGTSSTALGATIDLTTGGVFAGAATLGVISDGSTIDTLGTTALPSQTIGVGATVYNFATASPVAPNPVVLGELHTGTPVTQVFTIANTATADGFSENLDGAFTGASAGITTGGTVSELAAGSSSTGLNATIDLTSDGVFSGAATLGLISDGSTIDTLGTTALPSETIAVGGTAYNYATASVSPSPIAFGEAHVGDTVTQALTITNTAPADAFSEELDATIASSGSITSSGSVSELAAGGVSTALTATLDTANAGSLSGFATLGLISDGFTVDTLGTTALPAQTIAASGDVFRLATASVAGSIDFGIVHVGDTVSDAITIANTDSADGFSENLDATAGSAATGFTLAGTADEIGAGSSSDALTATLDTATAGTFSGDGTIGLISDGSTIDTLGTTALPDATISLAGTVLNFATAAFDEISGTGSLSGSATSGYTLDLGTLAMGGAVDTADLGVLNTAIGPADTLAGSFAEAGSGFSLTGFGPFTDVTAGGSTDAGTVDFNPVALGTYFETLTLDPTGFDPSFSADLAPVVMLVEADVTCFAAGTRIATPAGETAVERLRIGDAVVTASGAVRPIRWVGQRSYAGRIVAGNRRVLPVLIRAGALADNVPRRDLYVSPNHAMHIDGALIPAIELVNGASIVQVGRVDRIAYFHIELDTHDVLLAEGAPAESFVDDDSRMLFHNAAEYRQLYPDAAPAAARYCAPRVEDGEELEAVRRRLAARAAQRAEDGRISPAAA